MLSLVLAAALAFAAAGPARGGEPPIGDCDRLAAHPEDNERVRSGISFAKLDAEGAIAACEAALIAEPERARFRYQYARALHKAGKLPEALKRYREAAAQDYAAAQYALGLIFSDSKAMPWNQIKAAGWYRKAAETGHPGAQFKLGLMYRAGRGLPQDYAEALRWFRAAAAKGLARAQFILGRMYDEGLGIAEDDLAAAAWYRKAAEQGYGRARFALAALEKEALAALYPNLSATADRGPAETAEEGKLMARTAGDVSAAAARPAPPHTTSGDTTSAMATDTPGIAADPAHSVVADALEAGLAAYQAGDYQAAFDAWLPLAKRGVRRAEFYIGGLFMEGQGVEGDKVQAYYWLKRAAVRGYPAAQPLLVELSAKMSAEEMRRAEELIAAGPPGS